MAERDSWAVMNGATRVVDAEDTRIANGALWTPGATAIAARQGIRPGPGTPFQVRATGTPGANVTVDLGQMNLTATRGFGSYTATLDTTKTVAILDVPADPSNQRNDLIIATQSDTFYSDGSTAYLVRRVQGTPNASPVDPSLAAFPDRILLARVRVTANATTITNAMIDDLRPGWTVGLGGVVPVKDLTDRGTLTQWPGLQIYRIDKGWNEVSDGTAWRVLGVVTVAALADITNPFAGQRVILNTDAILYKYTGSAWVPVLFTEPPSVEYGQTGTPQTIPISTDTRLLFNNPVNTSPSITAATVSGGTEFTLNQAGRVLVTVQVQFGSAAGNNTERYVGLVDSATPATRFAQDNGVSNTAAAALSIAKSISRTRRYAAGAKLAVIVFQSDINTLTMTPANTSITIDYLAP